MQIMEEVDQFDSTLKRRIMTTDTAIPMRLAVDFTYWGEIIDKVENGRGKK